MKKLALYICFLWLVPTSILAQYTGGIGRGDSSVLIPDFICTNPTNGGTIGADQTNCGAFHPAILTSLTLPSGETGTLQYKWQQSTTSATTGFSDISASNTAFYNPGIISQTTWFKRVARVDCQTTWTGAMESNVICITITPAPTITLNTSSIMISGGTTLHDLFYSNITGNPTTYSLDYDSTANANGFTDVVNANIIPGEILLVIPPGAAAITYTAILTVTNASGCSSIAYPISITITGFAYTITQDIGTTLMLTWTAIPNASHYIIQYRLHLGGAWLGAPAYLANYSKLNNLQANTAYDCRVMIYKNGTFWGYSPVGSFTTTNVPYNKTQDIGTTVQMSWNNFAPWAVSYVFQYRIAGNTTWIGVSTATNQVKITNLLPDTDYECQLRVYKSNALWGICKSSTFHTEKVQFTTSQDIGTTLLLAWTPFAGNPTSYQIQYKPTGSTAWLFQTVYSNPAKLSNLTPETNYEVRVTPYINNIAWGTSQTDTITTGKVKLFTMDDNFTSMEIGWLSMSPWATSYILEYTLPGTPNWISSVSTNSSSVTILPILPGQDYFLRLKVYIGTDLWGITKEQKIGRNNPPAQNITAIENPADISTTMNIYPNPFVELIHLEITAEDNSACDWTIYDMSGRQVAIGRDDIVSGVNTININASDFSKGVYTLTTIIQNEKHDFRILKQ